MAKNQYTKSRRVIVSSVEEMKQKIVALKKIGKPIYVALIKNPKNFNQELIER